MADQYKELDYKAAEIDSILLDVYNSKGENSSLTARLSAIDTAISNKVDKVSGKGLSTNDFTDADKQKLDSLHNYDDTALSGRVSDLETSQAQQDTEIATVQSEVDIVVDNSVKNEFRTTISDIVPASTGDFGLVVNSDGSFTTSGSKSSAQFLTIGTFTPKKSGNYKLSSGIAQDVDTHCLYIKIGSTYYWARATGITIPMEAGTTYTVTLKIAAGYQNAETYYPMIRSEKISDSTFQPYSPTNRELYEMILTLQQST